MLLRFISRYKRILLAATLLVTVYLFIFLQKPYIPLLQIEDHNHDNANKIGSEEKPKLAVLVPFRDRFDELMFFVPHLSKFLIEQNIKSFSIYILNQSSRYRFNRGALTNVGFQLIKDDFDYIAIHDVDILPLNKNLSYSFPKQGPYHLTSPEYHPQYNYERYLGGILLINNKHFELVNGMSNRYFGWGLEDDEFYTRIRAAGLPITRPTNLTTNRNNTFLHIHHKNRKRDTFKTKEQREVLRRRDRITGLRDIKYSMTSKRELTIDKHFNCTIFNIELYCDIKLTPWCSYNHSQRSDTTNILNNKKT